MQMMNRKELQLHLRGEKRRDFGTADSKGLSARERSFGSLRSLRIRILFLGDREAVNVGCSIVKERMLRAGREQGEECGSIGG